MEPLQRIVVVSEPALGNDLLTWLPAETYRVTTVRTFAAAKAQLRNQPNLVITQLKLGEHNGLHLALRARCQGIPAVVIGEPDAVFERDAVQLGARYVTTEELGREQMLSLAQHLIPGTDPEAQSDDRVRIMRPAPARRM
jgi:DNA-binding response OmpR family regulator